MQENSKTCSTMEQTACNKALQAFDGRIQADIIMPPFAFRQVCFEVQLLCLTEILKL